MFLIQASFCIKYPSLYIEMRSLNRLSINTTPRGCVFLIHVREHGTLANHVIIFLINAPSTRA